jgi:hypothetical protein
MADFTSVRRSPTALTLSALLLASCGSSGYSRLVSVNPADASVYVNGERIGQGSSRPFTFDFSQCERIYVQATHPDYQPEFEWFTLEKIQQMIQTNTEVKLTLRSR